MQPECELAKSLEQVAIETGEECNQWIGRYHLFCELHKDSKDKEMASYCNDELSLSLQVAKPIIKEFATSMESLLSFHSGLEQSIRIKLGTSVELAKRYKAGFNENWPEIVAILKSLQPVTNTKPAECEAITWKGCEANSAKEFKYLSDGADFTASLLATAESWFDVLNVDDSNPEKYACKVARFFEWFHYAGKCWNEGDKGNFVIDSEVMIGHQPNANPAIAAMDFFRDVTGVLFDGPMADAKSYGDNPVSKEQLKQFKAAIRTNFDEVGIPCTPASALTIIKTLENRIAKEKRPDTPEQTIALGEPVGSATEGNRSESNPDEQQGSASWFRVLECFTGVAMDGRIQKIQSIVDSELSTDDKLWAIDAIMPLPRHRSKLAKMLGVTPQALGKDSCTWWVKHGKYQQEKRATEREERLLANGSRYQKEATE